MLSAKQALRRRFHHDPVRVLHARRALAADLPDRRAERGHYRPRRRRRAAAGVSLATTTSNPALPQAMSSAASTGWATAGSCATWWRRPATTATTARIPGNSTSCWRGHRHLQRRTAATVRELIPERAPGLPDRPGGDPTHDEVLDALEDAFAQANSDSATLLVAMLGHGMVRREDFFFLSNDGTGRGDHERDVLLAPAAVHPPPRHTQQPLHQRRFDPQPLRGCGGAARRAGDDLDVPPETGEFDADRSASEYYGAGQALGSLHGGRARYRRPFRDREWRVRRQADEGSTVTIESARM